MIISNLLSYCGRRFTKINNNNVMLTLFTIIVLFILSLCFFNNVIADTSIEYDKSFTTIEIEEGDTLYSIADEYSVSVADIDDYINEVKTINNLKNDTIHTGCYLIIPVFTEK